MTVPTTARRAGPFNGNGVATSFPFTFKVFTSADVQVVKTSTANVDTTLVLDTDYTVTLNPDQDATPGGTITYPISGTPLATGEKLSAVGATDYDQQLDLSGGGKFDPVVIENALDRQVFQIQQLAEKDSRTLQVSVATPTAVDTTLPVPESNNLLGWNTAANGLQNVDPTTLATIVAFGTAVPDIFTGDGVTTAFTLTANPGALGNLDVAVGGVTQLPGVDYFWTSGTALTFASAPANGVKILVRYIQGLPQGYTDSAASSWVHSLSGAVARVVQDRLRDTVSVKDFGAKGDGTTDDGAAFRAAVSAVSAAGGGRVDVPAGTYKVTCAGGDTSNTAIYVPSNVYIAGAGQVGTKIVPGANNTVCFRVTGLNGGIENLQIDNVASTYSNVSGIRLAPADETSLTVRSDIEFNNFANLSIRRCAEAITLRPGPTVLGQDSYSYYNTFTNIDIRNCTLGIWLKAPPTQPGSGNNRNTFISVRVGESGCNTGLKIDAGDTCKFIACSFEGINSGTSPNATPTAVQLAYNTATYGCVNNQFHGLIIEACTRDIDNDNDKLELYGWFGTGSYYSPSGRLPTVDIRSTQLAMNAPLTVNTLTLNASVPWINFAISATRQSWINPVPGVSGSYNGTVIANNTTSAGAQANTALPSWAVDIGGAEVGSGIGISDAFQVRRKAAGAGSWVSMFYGDSGGAWKPAVDISQPLGTAALRWSTVYTLNAKLSPVTVASLPAAGTIGAGAKAFVSDANATTFASIVAGGGANNVPVYSDGTNWRIG